MMRRTWLVALLMFVALLTGVLAGVACTWWRLLGDLRDAEASQMNSRADSWETRQAWQAQLAFMPSQEPTSAVRFGVHLAKITSVSNDPLRVEVDWLGTKGWAYGSVSNELTAT